jgi:YVTN family beta-propeller protein
VFAALLLSLSGLVAAFLPAFPSGQPATTVRVMLLPLPQESARLSFVIDAIAVVSADGTTYPLKIDEGKVHGRGEPRERLLASGSPPPGRYLGLLIEIGSASIEGPEGRSVMRTRPEASRLSGSFAIRRGQTTVLTMDLDPAASLREEGAFDPVFVVAEAARPDPAVFGLVSSSAGESVTVFHKVSGLTVSEIPLGGQPAGIALDDDARRAYVALPRDDAIASIELSELDLLRRLRLRGGDRPTELALTPDGSVLLSVNGGSNTVSIIDAASMIEFERIKVGERPRGVLVDRSGRRAYVFNADSGSISVLDIARRALAGSIATEPDAFRGAFSRTGEAIYVAHETSPYLSVVDPESLTVTGRVYVGASVATLAVDTNTDLVFVALRDSPEIEIYDPLSLMPIDAIPLPEAARLLAIDSEQDVLFVLLEDKPEVLSIPVNGKAIRNRIVVGNDPYWIAVSGGE